MEHMPSTRRGRQAIRQSDLLCNQLHDESQGITFAGPRATGCRDYLRHRRSVQWRIVYNGPIALCAMQEMKW
ncbi:hypothetical protein D9X30_2866 [Cupriavidus sp. U2]|nr:hypothetical protein D9X30_2866 [Cupriavidus sp. U2]